MKNPKIITKISLFALISFVVLIVRAGVIDPVIIAFDTNGNAGNEVTINSTTTNANLNTSVLSRGLGLNASAATNTFSSTSFTNGGTFSDAITNNDYVQFTVSAQSGYKVSLSTLDAVFRRSSTGPNRFQYQYSLNGFTTNGVDIGSEISFETTTAAAQNQIDLSGIAALQNVSSGTTITIRLYGYGATSTAGTFAIGPLAGNDLAIRGTVTAITTAATATVGGRVTEANGRAIFRARVTLIDSQGLERTVYTNTQGYYNFADVAGGQTYIFSVAHRRYQFAVPSLVEFVDEDDSSINFVSSGERLLAPANRWKDQ